MQLKQIVDLIAANSTQYPCLDSYQAIPLGLDDTGRLLVVVDEPLSDELMDDLCFMLAHPCRQIETDHDTFIRLLSFYRSRLGARGSGHVAEIDCEIAWKFKCPKDWATMSPTADPLARHCQACDRQVVLCGDESQIKAAKQAGACVAIGRRNEGEGVEMLLGEVE